MKWKLICEEYTPSDTDSINAAFNKDTNYKKYTPTKEFLKTSYAILNDELFNNKLPSDFEFKIEHDLNDKAAGHTYANDNEVNGKFMIDCVSLNGTMMMTLHSWLETILHEMIHVMDFKFHPEHFVNEKMTEIKYDEHGEWFTKQASKFKDSGFNVEKTIKSNVETSVDDDEIKQKHSSYSFLKISSNPLGWDEMLKINSMDKNKVLSILKDKKYSKVIELKTENLNSTRLENTRVESDEPLMTYHADDSFNRKYGPFEEVEEIDLTKMTFTENNERINRSTMIKIRLPNGGWQYRT